MATDKGYLLGLSRFFKPSETSRISLNLLTRCLISFLIDKEVSKLLFSIKSPDLDETSAPIHLRLRPNNNAYHFAAEKSRQAYVYE